MNKEQLTAELLQIVKSTKDFTLEHAPDVCSQIVTMGRFYTIIGVLMILGISTLLGRVCYRVFKKEERFDDYEFIIVMLNAVIVPLGALITYAHIEAWFAPKLYLLKYVKDLL